MSAGPKTILVMDDSPIVLDTVEAYLAAAGYAVLKAASLAELERHLAEQRPNLFVLDVQMPEVFGDDVGRVLRDVRAFGVPIVLFSGLDEAQLAERAERAELAGYVTKAAGLTKLLETVGRLLADGEGPGEAG